MMRSRSRSSAVAVGTLLLVALGTTPGLGATPSVVGSHGGRSTTEREQQSAVRYWTSARMRAAVEVTPPAPARSTPRLGATTREVRGRPGLVPGSGPGADTSVPSGTGSEVYDYPFPYTGYAVESQLYGLAPYRAVGKIFFRQNGTDFVCSGASVAGGTLQVVYTAGHCLSDGDGHFSTRIVFVPAYRNGAAPFGRFPYKHSWVLTEWHQGADLTVDYGAFDVAKNGRGQKLRNQVGKLGFGWNLDRDLHWNSFGFPAESPFTGEVMHTCQASRAADDLETTGINPQVPIAIGCHMTGGSSGGPWIYRLKKGNYLNSVNSYGYDETPEAMFGPYFGSAANALRCIAAFNDPTPPTSCTNPSS